MAGIRARMNLRTRLGVRRGTPTRKLWVVGENAPTQSFAEGATIVELSGCGLLVETRAELDVGEPIEICLPEIGGVCAQVTWVGDDYAVCSFERTLTKAALARVKLRTTRVADAPAAPEPGAEGSEPADTLGRRITRLRKQRGYTMLHFASRIGVSKPTLWKWEKDTSLPQQKTLKRIAEELDTSEQVLLYGFPNPHWPDDRLPEHCQRAS